MTNTGNPAAEALVARIAALDGFRLTLAFETWLSRIEAKVEDGNAVIAGVTAQTIGIDGPTLASWASDARTAEAPLDGPLSLTAARTVLIAAANISAFRPDVEQAIEHPDDTRLKAGVTLKIGALATALMLVASTSVQLKTDHVTISKEPLSAELITAITNLVAVIRGQVRITKIPSP